MFKRALVFQHMDNEPPGLYGEFLREAGARVEVVHLHRGEDIPSLAPFDFLLCMGGAMDVWETEAYPWLVAEKAAIREWALKWQRPYMGVCLGLQLLTEALDGEVGLARAAEVGMGDIRLTGEHRLSAGLARDLRVMQWHHAEVTKLPAGAEVLASSDVTEVQIMAIGDHLMGTQFHGELTPRLIDRWAEIPQYIEWLDAALGPNAYARVKAEALPQMAAIRQMSKTLFDNLLQGKAISQAA
jgi:GMP synthase-like glutamine amidotransferase